MSPKLALEPPLSAALKKRIADWEHDLRPRNHIEQFLARQAASLSFDLEQAQQVIAVRTAYQARVGPQKEIDEAKDQAIKIGQELIVQASEEWVARNRYVQNHDMAKSKTEPPLTPAELCVHRLEATADGCRWLIDRWIELIEIFDERLLWGPADERKAILFLGKTPENEDNAEIRELQLSSSVMTGIRPPHIASLTEENVGRPVPSKEEARDRVKAICKRAIDRLHALASFREELFRIDPEENRLRFAFDGTDVGKELRREQSTKRRELLKMLDTLMKMQKQPAATDEPTEQTERASPRSVSDRKSKQPSQWKARSQQTLKERTSRIINGGEAMAKTGSSLARSNRQRDDAARSVKSESPASSRSKWGQESDTPRSPEINTRSPQTKKRIRPTVLRPSKSGKLGPGRCREGQVPRPPPNE